MPTPARNTLALCERSRDLAGPRDAVPTDVRGLHCRSQAIETVLASAEVYDNSTEDLRKTCRNRRFRHPTDRARVCIESHLRRLACMALSVHTWTGMQINLRYSYEDFGNAGGANLVKVCCAQQGFGRVDEQASEGTGIVAHMKVIAPLTSTGPSVCARVVNDSASVLIVRFPNIVFAGALVQIRIGSRVLFGKARRCIAKESEYEIEIEKLEIY